MTKEKTTVVKTDKALPTQNETNSIPASALNAQLNNDWTGVNEQDRLRYAVAICKALDIPTPINPFRFIKMPARNNRPEKTVLYAPNEAAQLIADAKKMSLNIVNKYLDKESNVYFVEVRASFPTGRTVDNIGTLYVGGLTGEMRANAYMKCVTKALRRTVFAAAGLSVADDDDLAYQETHAHSTTYPTPPTAPAPYRLQGLQSGQTVDPEADDLKALLFKQLIGKGGQFEGRVAAAKNWIEENAGKPFDKLDANDANELLSKLELQDDQSDDAPTIPLEVQEELPLPTEARS